MQFSSVRFLLFLLVVLILYYILRPRYRNYLLLAASYYFYFSFKPEYLVILLGSTLVNYSGALGMEKRPQSKKLLLTGLLIFNLGLLFFFKYFNFTGSQLNALFRTFSLNLSIPAHSLILPIGISFYTFMALGYILDVYWGDLKAQKDYLTFSLYLAFFPYILSGPIGRAKNLFVQFTSEHPLLYANFSNGFRLMLWGFFKKMVIADNLGLYVDAVFSHLHIHSSLTVIVASLLYPLQLFTDFSGYTDIARGVGRMFGYDLMVNFRAPYHYSHSITEFWRRNHISLTSWLRDYVFYPLMGFSTSRLKVHFGILVMFLASGIWHGASWMFIIWGLLQALYLITEDITGWDKKFNHIRYAEYLKRGFTYLLLSLSLLFFRLPDLRSLVGYMSALASNNWKLYYSSKNLSLIILLGLAILTLVELVLNKQQFDEWIGRQKLLPRWIVYQTLAVLILLIGNIDGKSFIYFQF
jgi:D-alanyl-lipoteichoic acid acyltransferase DltB (MBOAT superfamily)